MPLDWASGLSPFTPSLYIEAMTRTPRDIADRMARARTARQAQEANDGFRRETFALPREAARDKARELLKRFPKAAYMTEIESFRELPGDIIEFTVRRLPTAD